MQRFSVRIIIALSAFVIGITAFIIWVSPLPEFFQTEYLAKRSCSLAPKEYKISDLEAIELAECFVITQGYTAYPPAEDKSKLQYEFFGDSSVPEEVLNQRHNMLKSKAYGVRYEERINGWRVVFHYNFKNEKINKLNPEFLEHLKTVGRVVIMDAYGGSASIEHEDFEFSKFQKVEEIAR
jgi:hypothetical protein